MHVRHAYAWSSAKRDCFLPTRYGTGWWQNIHIACWHSVIFWLGLSEASSTSWDEEPHTIETHACDASHTAQSHNHTRKHTPMCGVKNERKPMLFAKLSYSSYGFLCPAHLPDPSSENRYVNSPYHHYCCYNSIYNL